MGKRKDTTRVVDVFEKLIEARESIGEIKITGVETLDEALAQADRLIRQFIGGRDFVMWKASSETMVTDAGAYFKWNVVIAWRVL